MDNLPKDKTSDLSGFSGTYPEQAKGSGVPPVNPFGAAPAVSAELAAKAASVPFSQDKPAAAVIPEPISVTPPEPVSTVKPAVPVPTPPPAGEANPFVVQASAGPPKGGGGGLIKRVAAILMLLVVLGGLGYVGFGVFGKFLAGRQPKTLTYWGLWEDETVFTSLVAEYKQTHPNVDIVYSKQSPRQYRERLQAAIARGEGPDLFRFHATWMPMLKNDLAPADKTGYTPTEFQQTFYQVAVRDLVVAGQVYGVPLMFDGLGLYYNEDLLRAAGITPPSTWEAFRQAALTLTVKDETGAIVTAGAALGTAGNVEHFSDILGLMMLQNGANLAAPNGKEAQDALFFYLLFAEKGANTWDETLDNSIVAFANGRVAMIFAPSWQVFTLKDLNPNLKFQVIPVPQLPGTNVTWASYWAEGVSGKSKYTAEAWEFLKFLSSKESLVTFYTEASKIRAFGEPYSRVDLAQTITGDPYAGAFIKQAQTAESFYLSSRTFDNGINDRMIKYLEDTVNSLGKGVAVQAALETAAAGFNQVLSSFGASSAR